VSVIVPPVSMARTHGSRAMAREVRPSVGQTMPR
jgi:hypothetical protein